MKYQTLAAMIAVTLTIPATAAAAPGYLTDSSGSIVRNSAGECWHTGFWTPEMAVVGCDGRLAEPEAQVMAPPEAQAMAPVELDADTYFEFDRADLKPEARDKLDALLTELKNRDDVQQVRIVGHTDRIGDESYNQDLSVRRARSVSDYLLARSAISRERIEMKGMGESQPVVACEGVRGSEVISCLAPNRRVIVEVVTAQHTQ